MYHLSCADDTQLLDLCRHGWARGELSIEAGEAGGSCGSGRLGARHESAA